MYQTGFKATSMLFPGVCWDDQTLNWAAVEIPGDDAIALVTSESGLTGRQVHVTPCVKAIANLVKDSLRTVLSVNLLVPDASANEEWKTYSLWRLWESRVAGQEWELSLQFAGGPVHEMLRRADQMRVVWVKPI